MERNKEDNVIEDEKGNTFRFLCTENSIYDDPSIFMVSWWGIDSYLNSKKIQMSDIEIMNAAFGSSRFLDQDLGQNVLCIRFIQVEGATSVQNQHL